MNLVALGDVAAIERQSVDPTSLPPDTLYLGLEHIERGGRIIGTGTVGGAELVSNKFRFTPDHVLFGKLRPNLAKVSRPEFSGVCSTDILPIRPGPHLDRGYLAHYLVQPTMVKFATTRTTGANLPRLSPTVLATFAIPLPPLDEQRRIAAILDRADALRATRHQVLAHLDSLPQAVLQDSFRNVTGGQVPIGEFAEVRTGATPSRDDPRNFGGSIPWVKTAEVRGTITSTSEGVTKAGFESAHLRLFPIGSVLIAMYGQGKTRGQSAILGVEAATNQACAVVLPNAYFDPVFLQAQMSSSYHRLRTFAEGGNQPNLSIGRIQRFPVTLPPIGDQRAFAARVGQINRQRGAMARLVNHDNSLFASLQYLAFEGRL